MAYAYNYASNRTLQDIPSSLYPTNDRDQTYGYDGLNRLKNFDQGVYTTSIASPTQEQDWTLHMLVNWSAAYVLVFAPWNRIVQVKDSGSTVATFGYDGLHRRITKTVGGTTEQHYNNVACQ